MALLINALLIGGAGAIGTLLRAGCTTLSIWWVGTGLWGTFVVNILGSFAFGGIVAFARVNTLPAEYELALLLGLLGGFTTYSSFAFQSAQLLSDGRIGIALLYMLSTNTLSVLAVWAGLRLGS
ncbi:MAG: CrcB family protein [Pirellulales bacterium]